ncbi:hypothetical protein EDD36DRAFT_414817 [Exophiala viscosa]|uniref:Uncharacterized protein n=1 Tax=Exophiala viscosa TaxID=2486360 RepID=A0AAN6E730_9EURO|nr:hypothetical protein EDD36DRAFT_414817 [Exophiala viscosa]
MAYILRAGVPEKILSAVARLYDKDKRVDAAMTTTLLFKDQSGRSVHSRVYTNIARGWLGGVIPRVWELPQIEIETDKCHIVFYNAMMPHLYHYISITDKAIGTTTYKHQYSGGPVWGNVQTSAGAGGASYWSTYNYQLEAFVSKLQGGYEESIKQMQTIDQIYSAPGLPIRPGKKIVNRWRETEFIDDAIEYSVYPSATAQQSYKQSCLKEHIDAVFVDWHSPSIAMASNWAEL